MIIYINIVLLFMGITAFFLGISFLNRERYTPGTFKYSVFLLSFSCGLAITGYTIMAFSTNLTAAFFFRDLGLLGIMMYQFSETFLVVNDLISNTIIQKTIYYIVGLSMLVDMIIWGHPDAHRYIRYYNYTSYTMISQVRHHIHYTYLAILWIFMFTLAVVWSTSKQYKRDRQFVFLTFVSNILMLSGAIPDIIGGKFASQHPYVFYTGGCFFAFITFYIAASRYSAFFVTVNSLGSDVFTTINSGLIVFNTNGKLNIINKYAQQLLGIDDNHTQTLSDIFEIVGTTEISIYNVACNSVASDYRFYAKSSGKMCLVNVSVKKDRSNEPICFLVVVTDLTEENRLIAEAQAANEAKSAFLSNMSHEIRTPINAIIGMNEMILQESQDNDILSYSRNISTASNTLLSLINDILDFNKIESGHLEIVHSDYNLGTIISDCYQLLASRAQSKSQTVKLIVDPNIPSVLHGDELRIKQIITNLLTNAVKYTPEHGKIALSASYTAIDANNISLCIMVSDTGIGIKSDDLDKLFSTFTRLDLSRNRNIEGSGLGLSITSNLVHLMDGSISVKSEYGEGSTFTVTLPQLIVDTAPIGDISTHEDTAPISDKRIAFEAPDARILVVDDSPMNIEVFIGLLKRTKMQIDSAADGYEALEKVQRTRYDIIYMDHMMPGLNGVQVLEKMHQLDHYPNEDTPVIMLTANALIGADEEYKKVGFNEYVAKPVKPSELEKTVIRFLPDEMVTILSPVDDIVKPITNDVKSDDSDFLSKTSEILNVQTGLEYCANDVDFYKSMIQTYVTDNKQEKMTTFYEQSAWNDYRIVVHSIKGTSLTIGAIELSEHAKGLEFAVKEDNIAYIHENHASVLSEYVALVEQLSQVLE